MRRQLPALLVLSISAGAWSCSSSDAQVPDGAAGRTETGTSGISGVRGDDGAAASGAVASAVGAAGAPGALGGSFGAAGTVVAGASDGGSPSTSGGGAAGSAIVGTGTAGTGSAGANGGAASGGSNGSGSSAGGSNVGGASGSCVSRTSTETRPQLSSSDAAKYTILKYFAQPDNWDPTAGLGKASSFTPNFTVASDGTGTHTTVQAAISAASGTARRYILIKPGSYRGAVSYSGATPLTLYGLDSDATQVVILNDASAAAAGGTDKSATFTSKSNGLQLLNLTISNDYATPATGTNIQAVALYVTGDKTILQNVRLHGFQDTLFADIPAETSTSRVYLKNSFVEGDTDFIFGAATLVIDGSSINYLSSRKASGGGACLAPSTRVGQSYGFLVINSQFTSAPNAIANKVSLGRSWDEGSITPTPNGQAVVRECVLGAHIRKVDPWAAAATSGRVFSAAGNRFSEYCDSGVGSGP